MDFFNPKKTLGQHFLKDSKIADKIVDSLNRDKKDLIIEIGPGRGILTQKLVQKYSNLYLIEIDEDLLPLLKLKFPKLEKKILNMDFLKFTFENNFKKKNVSIIGNFPYNISSQIIFKIIENKDHIDSVVGMFQKEVAKRICEKPGSKMYGITSVLTQLYFDVKYLFSVPPEVFTPKPKVFSGVLYLSEENSDIEFLVFTNYNVNDIRQSLKPKKGQILLFDGKTYHRVTESKKERISLAFNIKVFLK